MQNLVDCPYISIWNASRSYLHGEKSEVAITSESSRKLCPMVASNMVIE